MEENNANDVDDVDDPNDVDDADDVNNDENANYRFPIRANEPVADPRAATYVLADAPAIEANQRCAFRDLSNCIREVNNRIFLKTQPPELVTSTSDDVSSAVVRQFVVTSRLAKIHYGEHADAPFWVQEILDQGRENAARATADIAALRREAAALRRDSVARDAALRTEAAALRRDLTAQVAGLRRDLTAQVAGLTNQVRESEANTNNRLQSIDIKLANIEARRKNLLAGMAHHPLFPIRSDDGALPENFPATLSAFHRLTHVQVTALLRFYGNPIGPRLNQRRGVLHQVIGISK